MTRLLAVFADHLLALASGSLLRRIHCLSSFKFFFTLSHLSFSNFISNVIVHDLSSPLSSALFTYFFLPSFPLVLLLFSSPLPFPRFPLLLVRSPDAEGGRRCCCWPHSSGVTSPPARARHLVLGCSNRRPTPLFSLSMSQPEPRDFFPSLSLGLGLIIWTIDNSVIPVINPREEETRDQ